MFSHLAKWAIGAFERRWGYDASYMREVLAVGGIAAVAPLEALAKVSKYRRDVPVSVYYAAKLTASVAADRAQIVAGHARRAFALYSRMRPFTQRRKRRVFTSGHRGMHDRIDAATFWQHAEIF